jgi:hypothetical protein
MTTAEQTIPSSPTLVKPECLSAIIRVATSLPAASYRELDEMSLRTRSSPR